MQGSVAVAKPSLREIFKNDFASSAFRIIDGEQRIIGKFIDVEIVDGQFDLWLVRPDREPGSSCREAIGARKLNNLIRAIESLSAYDRDNRPHITKLDGECYLRTTSTELVRESAFVGGVKRKKRYSEAALQASIERLRQINAA